MFYVRYHFYEMFKISHMSFISCAEVYVLGRVEVGADWYLGSHIFQCLSHRYEGSPFCGLETSVSQPEPKVKAYYIYQNDITPNTLYICHLLECQ